MSSQTRRWPISATQWIFGREDIATTADRLARLGYDGIELAGEPDQYPPDAVRRAVEPHGLRVTSICGIYTPERDLSHPSQTVRAAAIGYVRSCVELAAAVGASTVIVVPTAVGRIRPEDSRAAEWRWAVASLREAAAVADAQGIRLVIESLNRYETYLVNTLSVAADLVTDVGRSNVGLMADVFHMNIEEASLVTVFASASYPIWHVHLADSNRRAPGLGHINFAEVIRVLPPRGYDGPLTMEFLPPTANPYLAASLDVPEAQKSADATQALTYVDATVQSCVTAG